MCECNESGCAGGMVYGGGQMVGGCLKWRCGLDDWQGYSDMPQLCVLIAVAL
jgi:hypothetical protein